MTPAAVEEKYGLPPHRYPELAALVGETSDNLPGVPGVGPKTAAKWITTYDGLDNVIAHADAIKGKAGDSFREHLGDVIRNRRLNALVCDLDLTATPRRPGRPAVGPPGGAHALRQPGVPGAARPAVRDPGVRGGDRRQRLRARRHPAGGRRARRLAGRARVREGPGRGAGAGHLAGRHRRRVRDRPGQRRRGRGLARRRADLARGRRGAGDVARRRVGAQGAARRQGADAGAGRAGLGAGRASGATPRCRRTSPVPTSAPTTWPT